MPPGVSRSKKQFQCRTFGLGAIHVEMQESEAGGFECRQYIRHHALRDLDSALRGCFQSILREYRTVECIHAIEAPVDGLPSQTVCIIAELLNPAFTPHSTKSQRECSAVDAAHSATPKRHSNRGSKPLPACTPRA